jgi:predicted HD phosphohydrolase
LHVAAKRWICATDPGYFDRLSPGSVRSLVWSVAQQCRGDQVRCRILARR